MRAVLTAAASKGGACNLPAHETVPIQAELRVTAATLLYHTARSEGTQR